MRTVMRLFAMLLSPDEANQYRRVVQEQAQCNSYPASLKYPEPGKYTIAGNKMAESSLASIAEHPTVVNAVECALGQPAHLTAFVAYLRSPGGSRLWRATVTTSVGARSGHP